MRERIVPMDWTPKRLRQFNKLIAEQVMGWRGLEWRETDLNLEAGWLQPEGWYGEGPNGESQCRDSYCTDIGAAWLVVEQLRKQGWRFRLYEEDYMIPGGASDWCANFERGSGDVCRLAEGHAPTFPLAVCLAAAGAMGLEVPPDA